MLVVRRAPGAASVRAAGSALGVAWLVAVGSAFGAGRTLGAGPIVDVLVAALPVLWVLDRVFGPQLEGQLRVDRAGNGIWRGRARVATLSDVVAVEFEDFSVDGQTPTCAVSLRLADQTTRWIASTPQAATAEALGRAIADYIGVQVEWA